MNSYVKSLGIEEHNGEKIDITDLQTAYLYGRKPEMILGGKGSRAYFSFEVEDVDIARLQKAIKKSSGRTRGVKMYIP